MQWHQIMLMRVAEDIVSQFIADITKNRTADRHLIINMATSPVELIRVESLKGQSFTY